MKADIPGVFLGRGTVGAQFKIHHKLTPEGGKRREQNQQQGEQSQSLIALQDSIFTQDWHGSLSNFG